MKVSEQAGRSEIQHRNANCVQGNRRIVEYLCYILLYFNSENDVWNSNCIIFKSDYSSVSLGIRQLFVSLHEDNLSWVADSADCPVLHPHRTPPASPVRAHTSPGDIVCSVCVKTWNPADGDSDRRKDSIKGCRQSVVLCQKREIF